MVLYETFGSAAPAAAMEVVPVAAVRAWAAAAAVTAALMDALTATAAAMPVVVLVVSQSPHHPPAQILFFLPQQQKLPSQPFLSDHLTYWLVSGATAATAVSLRTRGLDNKPAPRTISVVAMSPFALLPFRGALAAASISPPFC